MQAERASARSRRPGRRHRKTESGRERQGHLKAISPSCMVARVGTPSLLALTANAAAMDAFRRTVADAQLHERSPDGARDALAGGIGAGASNSGGEK